MSSSKYTMLMKTFHAFIIILAITVFAGCTADIERINDRIDGLEDRIESLEKLCSQMNTDIASLKTMIEAAETRDYITDVVPVKEGNEIVGYRIYFASNPSITIYNGEDGQDGATPQIGVRKDTDGRYYWTLNGEWLLDDNGNKVSASGEDGQDARLPKLKIEEGYWYVSYDDGATWTELGMVTGDSGYCLFKNVEDGKDAVVFTLSDGTEIVIPKFPVLEISFSQENIAMSANSSLDVRYNVVSAHDSVDIEVLTSGDIRAKAVPDDASCLTGVIRVETGATLDEYCKAVVLVSDGIHVVMRTLVFEESGLSVVDNTTKTVTAEGGEVTLEYLSNVGTQVDISEEGQSWISIVPDTKVMEHN